jgi:hypothetical protein
MKLRRVTSERYKNFRACDVDFADSPFVNAIIGGNHLHEAHGKGKSGVGPASRHPELAAILAGIMATFLVDTWEDRKTQGA